MKSLVHSFARCWGGVCRRHRVLEPARACLLASLLVPGLFLGVDQGRDLLRRVVHPPETGAGVAWGQAAWLLIAIALTGVASWAWARFLLRTRFPGLEDTWAPDSAEERWRRIMRWTCGLLPSAGVTLASLNLARSGEAKGGWLGFAVLALASAATGVLLAWFFGVYHAHDRRRAKCDPSHRHTYGGMEDVLADRETRMAIALSVVVAVVLLVALTFSPIRLGQTLGAPALLLFAIGVWISLGSVVIYGTNHLRIPIAFLLAVWIVVISPLNDNHELRTLPKEHAGQAPGRVPEALDAWHEAITNRYLPGPRGHPLYLVAAAGGGIRAAYWTAAVTCELEDRARAKDTSWADHVFALSGVSGGALGAVVFDALLVSPAKDDPEGKGPFRPLAHQVLDNDFLAAVLAKMGFADLLQRALPFPVSWFDRARSLEDSWSAAWVETHGRPVLDDSLGELQARAARQRRHLPHLLLNGTCVEDGSRIITTDLALDHQPRRRREGMVAAADTGEVRGWDAAVADGMLGHLPIRASTAAHQSARFTYFSPAGRFPDADRTQIVDGGYFENSGAATLLDLLRVIEQHIAQRRWNDVEIRVVLIDNDPQLLQEPAPEPRRVGPLLPETLSPIRAMLGTREARGRYAVERAMELQREPGRTNRIRVAQFQLWNRGIELPLGWTLSADAIREMEDQLTCASPAGNARGPRNGARIQSIVDSLPKRRN